MQGIGRAGREGARDVAERLDAEDPLRDFRSRFLLPPAKVYLDGNSLGPVPVGTRERVSGVIEEQWGEDLVGAWNRHDWIRLPQRVGGKVARLIGAGRHEVVVTDSISINLFKLLAAGLRLRPGRGVILCEEESFPSDIYVAEGLVDLLGPGTQLRRVARRQVPEAFDDDVAVACLNHVDFKTGHLHDLEAVTAAGRRRGCLVLWDLAHSAGVMPLELRATGVEMAVGCGYKFLNGGPGAPSFLFLAEALQDKARSPLQGWMGHAAPFAFEGSFRPAPGLDRFLCGTPPILSLAALDLGCDLLLAVDLGRVREKSLRLGNLFLEGAAELEETYGLVASSPRRDGLRGSQVCFRHDHAYPIVQALIHRGIIGDFRAPDTLRFGLSPLILRYRDVAVALEILRDVLETGSWSDPRFARRHAVT